MRANGALALARSQGRVRGSAEFRPGGQNACVDTAPKPPSERPIKQPTKQPGNPLHGVTLEVMVTALAAHYGWAGLGERLPLRCFTSAPSVASSLKMLRKTPWAREKVESLYRFMLREIQRNVQRGNTP